jgi:predicted dehydrogenase
MACATVSRMVSLLPSVTSHSALRAAAHPVFSGRKCRLRNAIPRIRFCNRLQTESKRLGGTIWREIGIGIVGGGYMGKAHAVAMSAVGAVFDTSLRPRLEMIALQHASAERYRAAYGFARAAATGRSSWPIPRSRRSSSPRRIDPPRHRRGRLRARQAGVLRKAAGRLAGRCRAMVAAAEARARPTWSASTISARPPAVRPQADRRGRHRRQVTWFRGEHTEDFLADPETPANWRTDGPPTAPWAISPAHDQLRAGADRPDRRADRPRSKPCTPRAPAAVPVDNDDHGQMMCRFAIGAMGHLYFSRIATGRKMGYAYEITGTKGAIRFDQEDQNALWLYRAEGPEATRGFTQDPDRAGASRLSAVLPGAGAWHRLSGPDHHRGTGFPAAIETGEPVWPTFRDGLAVHA